jgi:glycosyltransferase involved in cell wall biosynthesis
MKILIINTMYYPNHIGGAERSVQFLAESLYRSGKDVVVVSLSMVGKERVVSNKGVKTYYIKQRNFFNRFSTTQYSTYQYLFWHLLDSFNPLISACVHRIIRLEKPDIINTHNISGFSPAVWILPPRNKCPIVHTIRDYYLLCPHSSMFKNGHNCSRICLECRFFSFTKKILSRNVNAVIGISDFVLQRHLHCNYFPNSIQHRVIYNSYEHANIRDPKQSNIETLTFGFLGRLQPKKGIELFLSNFNRFNSDRVFARIGGQGDERYVKSIQHHYSNTHVKYLGWVETAPFLAGIDVLVVPSIWHEPLGRVVIEAFAHGIPVIASNRGGLKELIDEGRTGFLFNPDIETDLYKKLALFKSRPQLLSAMEQNALAKAKIFFHSNMTNQYERLYMSLLSET